MGQDQSSVFDLAAVAAASNGGNNDPLLPPARFIGDPQKPSRMPYNKYAAYDKQIPFDYPERTWPGKRLQRALRTRCQPRPKALKAAKVTGPPQVGVHLAATH